MKLDPTNAVILIPSLEPDERLPVYVQALTDKGFRRFVIVDDYEIAGGGIATELLPAEDYDKRNIRWSAGAMTTAERQAVTGRKGLVVWMTGLSGAGKTTIAQEAERQLCQKGYSAYMLDGDKLRTGLCADLGFSDTDRTENIRRAAHVADLLRDAGNVVLSTFISPFRVGREEARRIAGDEFMEVYVKASLSACMNRDPKQLYKKAVSGQITSFTGIDSPYEEPTAADLVLDTEALSEQQCVDRLVEAILARLEGDAAF